MTDEERIEGSISELKAELAWMTKIKFDSEGNAVNVECKEKIKDNWLDGFGEPIITQGYEHRIKPEPKYRRYTAEELATALKTEGIFVREKPNGVVRPISGIDTEGDVLFIYIADMRSHLCDSFDNLLNGYIHFPSGNVCGVLIEEEN